MVRIPWKEKDGICSPVPDSMIPQGKPETVYLQPYGCTNLRMTEMPLAGQASDYNDFGENSRGGLPGGSLWHLGKYLLTGEGKKHKMQTSGKGLRN